MTTRVILPGFVAGFTILANLAAVDAAPLKNGGFEKGLKGWYVLSGTAIQVQGSAVHGVSAYRGTHWAQLGKGSNVLAQNITATPGTKFRLSFAVANYTAGQPSNTFVVEWCRADGNGCIPFANTTFNGVQSFGWKRKENSVVSDGTNKLEVSAFTAGNDDFWAVDDFRLSAVAAAPPAK